MHFSEIFGVIFKRKLGHALISLWWNSWKKNLSKLRWRNTGEITWIFLEVPWQTVVGVESKFFDGKIFSNTLAGFSIEILDEWLKRPALIIMFPSLQRWMSNISLRNFLNEERNFSNLLKIFWDGTRKTFHVL